MTYQYHDALDRYEARMRAEQAEREFDEQQRICDEMVAEVAPELQAMLDLLKNIDDDRHPADVAYEQEKSLAFDACGAEQQPHQHIPVKIAAGVQSHWRHADNHPLGNLAIRYSYCASCGLILSQNGFGCTV